MSSEPFGAVRNDWNDKDALLKRFSEALDIILN